MDRTLDAVGLMRRPEVEMVPASLPTRSRRVTLRLVAGERLNVDPAGQSLSVVVRIYRLRETGAFLGAPRQAFKDADSERLAFGSDVVAVREIVLAPGQRHEAVETLSDDARYLAVAALFRSPADDRWRFAFDARPAEKSGVTLAVLGCALGVAAGDPVSAPPEALHLAGVQCH